MLRGVIKMYTDEIVGKLENPATRERFALVAYLALMVVLVVPITVMAGQAWETEGLSYVVIMGFLDIIGLSLAGFSVVLLGVLIGLILLMLLDPKRDGKVSYSE